MAKLNRRGTIRDSAPHERVDESKPGSHVMLEKYFCGDLARANQAHLCSTLFARVQETRAEPKVKSAKTCKKSLRGVRANNEMPKSADPTCYNAHVDQTKESDMRTFKIGDRV